MLEEAKKLAYKKYDPSHMTVKKIRMKYALTLLKSGRYNESEEEFMMLEGELEK